MEDSARTVVSRDLGSENTLKLKDSSNLPLTTPASERRRANLTLGDKTVLGIIQYLDNISSDTNGTPATFACSRRKYTELINTL